MADVEQVKRTHPIADVIASHGVSLRTAGRRLMGRCPFHADDRPSFVVYPDTRSFHCFGCGASGDVIDFVRRTTGLGFREALAALGEVGVESDAAPPPPRRRERRDRPLSLDDRLLLTAACEVYHEALLRTPAALAYLRGRGLPRWLVRHARLGYADGASLAPYLKRRRLSLRRACELGLLRADGREALAGRLVVPEARGTHCSWLTGRALREGVEPRYLSLALPRPLLGLDLVPARQRVFVTEGPFDWLTLRAWGLPGCALLGTRPGPGAVRPLERFRSVVLVLDADEAGRAAAAALARALGERAQVLTLPDGVKDLSDLGRHPHGRECFLALLDQLEGRARDAAPAR